MIKKLQRYCVLIPFLFLSLQTSISAQEPVGEIPKDWIYKIVQYRDFLLLNNDTALYQLRDLLHKWDTHELSDSDQDFLSLNIAWSKGMYNSSDKSVTRNIDKYLTEKNIEVSITPEDIRTIVDNFELLELIKIGVLKRSYPFVIEPKTDFFKELLVYDIDSKDTVAEIGAGSGMFSILLKLIKEDSEIWINELNRSSCTLMTSLLGKHSHMVDTTTVHVVRGTKQSTNLELVPLDKVIIRNTFHHFKKKDKMLESIKASLKENGVVFLLEGLKEYHEDEGECQLEMTKEDIISEMAINGFILMDEYFLEGQALLKFRLE